MDKEAQYQAEYYKANKEKIREQRKRFYEANKEMLRAKKAKWDAENRDKVNEYIRRCRGKYPESGKAARAEWRSKNASKIAYYNGQRRGALKQSFPIWASDFLMEEAFALAKLRTEVTGIKWHVDHIVPLNSKLVCGLHCEFNFQVIPGVLNSSKGNRRWPDMP